MQKNNSQKSIESCIKAFSFLKLLQQGELSFSDAIDLFTDESSSFNSNTAIVTLNKYINTMKIFGINIIKSNKFYKILNPPYKIDLTETELRGFHQLRQFLAGIEGENFNDARDFLKSIEAKFSEDLQLVLCKQKSKNEADFKFYYSKFFDKIAICDKFCSEEYKAEIIFYKPGSKTECKINAKLEKLIYGKGKVRLSVINLSNLSPISIAINKIISIRQLPTKTTANYRLNNVIIFKLKDRLAENYTLRAWEYLDGKDENGNKIYVNKDEDENEFLHRILKYKTSCEILSPKNFKDKLITEIDRTLQLYEA